MSLGKSGSDQDFKLFGIFGYPLRHTLSPEMQEAGLNAVKLKAFYLPLELGAPLFKKALGSLRKLNLEGFNVTVPYKQSVIRYLDALTPEARLIGAVNTVFRKGKKWLGANTDAFGFETALKKDGGFSPKGKRALVLGAGGSARAVLYALCQARVEQVRILNRHMGRAKKLAADFFRQFPQVTMEAASLSDFDFRTGLAEADLVVNTTSVGLEAKDKALIPCKDIPWAKSGKRLFFMDLIYCPAETRFLKEARSRGHKTLNGLSMLLYQGTRSFEIWTKKKAPVVVMKQALENALAKKLEAA